MNEVNRVIFTPIIEGFKDQPDRHYRLSHVASNKKDRVLSWAVDVWTAARRGELKTARFALFEGVQNGVNNVAKTLMQRTESKTLSFFDGTSENEPWKDLCFPKPISLKSYNIHQSRHYHLGRQIKDTCYYVKHNWPTILAWTAMIYLAAKSAPAVFGATASLSLIVFTSPALVDDIKGYRNSHQAAGQIKINAFRDRFFSKLQPLVIPLGLVAAVTAYCIKFRGVLIPQEVAIVTTLFTGTLVGAGISKGALAFVNASRSKS